MHLPTVHPRTAFIDYLAEVTDALGIGLESCTLDHDTPVSAYIALDDRLPDYPDHDVALLWDEERGWSAAVEPRPGDPPVVISHLGGNTTPPPDEVVAFLAGLRTADRLRAA
ncbi:DUF6292 family protein [Actinokineospora bangkokensis]|uniref:DUF6292 domain-containing protein n=1 Tax=Actinokineospora bangkokensis TaxID=1193682 RepID=A0A1Q9LPA0_9PSEU|nr:DUF6292 family protein [Actinokineospora bangkokensis]OLR93848.1 hypothetical protein BJP25_16630 [Actinokineospora bangkokensis]